MPEIVIEEGDRLEWALKSFKKLMQRAGIFQELRKRRHYTKPSVARLMKSKAAQRARDKARRKKGESQ